MTEMNNHPELEQLLLLVDEGAATRSTRATRKHVAGCWKCRNRLEELEETVREFARYHEKIVVPNLSAAPCEWPDLRRRIENLDRTSEVPNLSKGVLQYFAFPASRLILGLVILACCAVAFSLAFRKKPTENPPPPAPIRSVSRSPMPERTSNAAPAPSVPHVAPAIDPEVEVFRALHAIQADIGDPVEVSKDPSGTQKVIGIGLSSARQAEIRDAISRIPGVIVTWQDSGNAAPSRSPKSIQVEAAQSPFEARLRQFAGGSAEWEIYSNRVLDESDAILARAHALRTITDHFPENRRIGMRASDLAAVDQIASDHLAAFRDHVLKLEALLAPVRNTLNAPAAQPSATQPELLSSARRMDCVVSVIFGRAATTETPSQLLADLSQASADLNAAAGGNE